MGLGDFLPTLPDLLKSFPKLENFDYSSNFAVDMTPTIEFIKFLVSYKPKRNFKFTLQASLDGPKEFNDINRGKGTTEKIIPNMKHVVKEVNKMNMNDVICTLSTRSTIDSKNINYLLEDNNLENYYDFFINYIREINELNVNKSFTRINSIPELNLALPGDYTSQDGKRYAELLKKSQKLFEAKKMFGTDMLISQYFGSMKRMFDFENEIHSKPSMFTCCAGDSSLQLSENDMIHMCSNTLFANSDGYNCSAIGITEQQKHDVLKYYTFDRNDKKHEARFLYTMGGYHKFWKNKVSIIYSLTKELALCNQVDKSLLDDEFCFLFSLWVAFTFSCPQRGLYSSMSLHTMTAREIKMVGNGAFQFMLDLYKRGFYKNE